MAQQLNGCTPAAYLKKSWGILNLKKKTKKTKMNRRKTLTDEQRVINLPLVKFKSGLPPLLNYPKIRLRGGASTASPIPGTWYQACSPCQFM